MKQSKVYYQKCRLVEGVEDPFKPKTYRPTHRETGHLPSRFDSVTKEATAKKENQHYTGTKLIGIAVMHKSNLVPVFNEDEAVDLARMRR